MMLRSTATHVRIVMTEVFFGHKKVDQLFESALRGLVQIFVEADSNVTRRCLGSRPVNPHVLAHNELKCAIQGSFHSGAVNFTVTLSGMAVANFADATVLRAAAAFEQARPWAEKRPPLLN